MKKITILSGKGGVGKSSIAASLAVALSKNYKLICADCDVDAANLALVFGIKKLSNNETIRASLKAKINQDKCTNCNACVEHCQFEAVEKRDGQYIINKYFCEGCQTCSLVCPSSAIELMKVDNADVGYAKTKYGFDIVTGQLRMGESGSGKVVVHVKSRAMKHGQDCDLMLVDAAAGIGCPVIASVSGSDYVIAVTEPTPSGFSDLKRALGMVDHFKIPYSIIINKCDLNPQFTREIENFAKKNNIDIISKIPYDKSFVDALVSMTPIISYKNSTSHYFNTIAKKLEEAIL